MVNNTAPELVGKIRAALQELEYDVSLRNTYIEKRDRSIWQDGLFEGLKFPDGHDVTEYNWGPRTVHVHASQLFGRGFQVYSTYNKEDDTVYQDNQDELDLAELRNKKMKANADGRKRAIDAMIRDNGGTKLFYDAGTTGSGYGTTVLKEWFDKDQKKTVIKNIETVVNCYVGWSDTDFREADYYGYVYQISPQKAGKEYGSQIPRKSDGTFDLSLSQFGQPFWYADAQPNTNDSLNRSQALKDQTQRPLVTVIEFTGYLKGYKGSNGTIVECREGDETRFNALIIDKHIVQVITEDELIPDYYVIPNIRVPRRPWGASDLTDSALSINQTYLQRMSDWITMYNKFLYPLYLGKGFDTKSIPKKKQRQAAVVPATQEQSLDLVDSPLSNGYEMPRVLEELKEEYVRVTGIGRVMFDDPSVSANSNQALMTTLKGVIDITEAKQKNWEDALTRLFDRALIKAAKYIPELKEIMDDADGNYLKVEWPSVLRREDATYQQIWLNLFNAGVISLDTYHEKLGIPDSSEEIDRIVDNLKNPYTAAVMGHQQGEIAHQAINKMLGIPAWGYVLPKVNLKGELAPQEVGNMAHNFQWDQGPYGDKIGPTGMDGQIAADNFMNAGFLNGNPRDGGSGNYQGPNPQLTSDQNTGQTASQPGSGAPAVSPQGAINQANQQNGR